ncbi:VOC family protein [Ornithinicoccus hortensis]|uniref:PhnB protein n=1 Tax=Ornithinicoccus hortensis TaxID=82346 RepID=A0A542YVM6_9MICO|nr:VOC family protein [Ornithinicoccus hortensis]TQL52139.1 PhnB protein [Ornithinicoccus hortensis]
MPTQLNAYLSFRDTARQAMEFYQGVFGGELGLSTFGEFGAAASDDPAEADKVMHAQLTTPSGMVLMGADTPAGTDLAPGSNFSMSLSGDDERELRGYWDALVEGGQVVEPLAQAPWGDHFGMCVDRFGTPWMVNIAGSPA